MNKGDSMKQAILIVLALLTLSFKLFAKEGDHGSTETPHCESTLLWENETYCIQLEWLQAEKRSSKGYEETRDLSPVANPGSPSPLYETLYSKAFISLEKDGGSAQIEGFNAKLYMSMLNGMHHSGPSSFQEETNGYIISQMNFIQMRGCWMIELYIKGVKVGVIDVTNYTNLTDEDNFEAMMFCDICSSTPLDGAPQDHDHD